MPPAAKKTKTSTKTRKVAKPKKAVKPLTVEDYANLIKRTIRKHRPMITVHDDPTPGNITYEIVWDDEGDAAWSKIPGINTEKFGKGFKRAMKELNFRT